jgi:pSer/pThr/pTyr-binding forkhead associated (FHA) protein
MISENPNIMVEAVNTPFLIIQTPTGIEKVELTAQQIWTFGRGSKNIVRLDDPFASRYHAKLQVNRFQHCCFIDLNSRNGTLLNDEPLIAPVWLKHGDRISIGETTLIFEHCREIAVDSVLETPPVSILMLHESVPQGEIWQEIFTTLNIPMVWEESSTSLKETLENRAISESLPQILLMDVRTSGNPYHFCTWCHQTFPQIQIFLLDSMRGDIPKIERQIAIKKGAINLFPAMNRHNLVLKSLDRLRDINEVLSILDQNLSQRELLNILERVRSHQYGA